MSLDTLLDHIVSVLEGIAGIGPVLKYARYTPDEKSRNETYFPIAGKSVWIITREATQPKDLGLRYARDRHQVVLHGYRAVTSAVDSEKLLQDEAEAVRAALHLQANRSFTAGLLTSPCAVRTFDARMFMNTILCWHAELILMAEDRSAITT